ncbi:MULTISPECIES: homoserine dehydrogenase [Pseudonocardia]|uniref:Homoserine dehydrogenase n=1 Tax=Pseudonocardia oroxyli TaxID=366584 RepID=A0A1G7N9G6_PSEOR|nr:MULTISPECIES: homoserine dehydrogenase [Pseudonocardia]MCF7550393.1 homoserine dehydrogenase [Pseudonocardia sp. WMMC193]SDF70547.1 homoserine dehydrogenase [Pseudonocardia oroxyli]
MSEHRPGSPVRVALLGCGTVGTEVVRLLEDQAADLAARVGAPVEIAGIAVRRPHRHPGVRQDLLTTDAAALVAREDVDVVVEVVGGIEPARTLLLDAIKSGKSVVTANKALLAEDGAVLAEAADAAGVDLYYEASVAGAIPLLRPLRESLAGDRITRVAGIVNGTTNFILSAMAESGAGYADALEEATRLGYAEADPTADVDGYDAASKAAILATIAFHTRVTAADVHCEGIRRVTAADIAAADGLGCVIKLLAICERVPGAADASESVSARVYPAMIPKAHPLAGVDGAFNAVFVEADAAGQLMFYGQGAGGAPTASAILGDLVAVARNRVGGGRGPRESSYARLPVRPMGDVPTRYHVSLEVADRAGVLSAVAGEFARRGVSIAAVRQTGGGEDGPASADGNARLVVVTHGAPDSALHATVEALAELDVVLGVESVLRVEGLGRPVSTLGVAG